MPYYAVHKGRSSPNVYNTWPECKREVDGLVGAVYKKFDTMEEAQQFMKQGFAAGSKPKGLIRHEKYESDNKDEIDAVLIISLLGTSSLWPSSPLFIKPSRSYLSPVP